MFGPLGFWEIAFILVLALLIIGPKRLPEFGRTIGRGLGEFRRASNELKRTINTEMDLSDSDEAPKRPRRPKLADDEVIAPKRVVTPAAGAVAQGRGVEAKPESESEPDSGIESGLDAERDSELPLEDKAEVQADSEIGADESAAMSSEAIAAESEAADGTLIEDLADPRGVD